MDTIKSKFNELKKTPLDINEHLETLYKYATKCESVIELGVRGCISSWALTSGLIDNNLNNKKIFLNDIEICDIELLVNAVNNFNNNSNSNIQIDYKWINDLDLELNSSYDLTFIDTWHIYGQLKRELNKFSKYTNKYIIMHDTTVDEIYGENIRCGWNIEELQRKSGFTREELTTGLKRAIDEFLVENSNWILKEKFTNNNGLTILERIK